MKKIVAILFILVGIGTFLYPKISNAIEKKHQIQIIKEYRQDVYNMKKDEKEKQYEMAENYNKNLNSNFDTSEKKYNNILNITDDGVMSYIKIPKISVYLPIYHGTQDKDMKKGVGHLENTSLPVGGNSSHCVLTGHTGLVKTEIFTRLDELKIEDEIYINTLDRILKYSVYQTKVVLPTETQDLKIQEGRDLVTLVTCTPYGVNTHRLLVQCERKAFKEQEDEEHEINSETKEITEENDIFYIKGIVLRANYYCINYFLLHFTKKNSKIHKESEELIMNILAVGDIVGSCGIKELQKILPNVKKEHKVDFTIVNGENSAEGMGLTEKNFKDILQAGADCVTMGNHTWGKKEIFTFIDNPKLIRPANYPKGVCGKGYNIYKCNGKKIAVINALGRAEINIMLDNPFEVVKNIVENVKEEADIIMFDFHAEATAEKKAMAYYLDGEITALFGTHTHTQTADEQILENGTGFITDIGMTGPKNSVIGMDKKAALKRFVTSLPERYKIASGEAIFNSVLFEIDDETNMVKNIIRINA